MCMKYLLLLFVFVKLEAHSQNFTVPPASGDVTNTLQGSFNNKNIAVVTINTSDVIVNGTLSIPEGKVLRIEPGGKISGNGTIKGGILEADIHTTIFDTALTVLPAAVPQYFSVKWYGASGKQDKDDYSAIQKSINCCIRANIRTVFIPTGRYKIFHPLIIKAPDDGGKGGFVTLELLGESSFWDANLGSEIFPQYNNTFAIGIQDGKGCKVRKLKLVGTFKAPPYNDPVKFFHTRFEDFTDGVSRDSRYSPYAGIVIDPFTTKAHDPLPSDGGYPGLTSYYGKSNSLSTQSGSTGTELEELHITHFVVGICSSPNGLTRNAEISIFNKIQFSDCKLCISGGQDQEKANVISNIYCWGGAHTIFATGLYGTVRQAGNWNIDHANIAGAVVRFIYNDQHGYFSTHISHVFAENLGTWGVLNSELAADISDCMIDFTYQHVGGEQTLLTSWGENIVYRSCTFRYYGEKTPLHMEGNCVFDHCFFSGPVVKGSAGLIKGFFEDFNVKGLVLGAVSILLLLLLSIFLAKRYSVKRSRSKDTLYKMPVMMK
jgi:hypothetical protein